MKAKEKDLKTIESLLSSDHIRKARDEYLKYNFTAPQQFNIQYHEQKGWRCEFHKDESCWYDCTTWMSGEEALNIFFSLDPNDVFEDYSWNLDLTEKELDE